MVIADTAGWGDRPRLTCQECGKTLMCQPYMSSQQWERLRAQFYEVHQDCTASNA